MFFAFAKRHWANRVIKQMGLPRSSQPAATLRALILEGTKHFEDIAQRSNKTMAAAEYVLLSTGAMTRNPNSIMRVSTENKMSVDQATKVILQVKKAGRELAQSGRYAPIVSKIFE